MLSRQGETTALFSSFCLRQGAVRTFSRSGPEAKTSMWNKGKRILLPEGAWQGQERKQSLGTVSGAWGDLFGTM